jgi:hypothetical protein
MARPAGKRNGTPSSKIKHSSSVSGSILTVDSSSTLKILISTALFEATIR